MDATYIFALKKGPTYFAFLCSPVSIIPTCKPVEAVNYELASGSFVFSRGQPVNVWRQALSF